MSWVGHYFIDSRSPFLKRVGKIFTVLRYFLLASLSARHPLLAPTHPWKLSAENDDYSLGTVPAAVPHSVIEGISHRNLDCKSFD
jgi:hypothetical protein